MKHHVTRGVATAMLAVALTACGSTTTSDSEDATDATTTTAAVTESSALSIRDSWVKSADSGMSAAFGVLVNGGKEDVRVTAATSDASPIMELHETVENESGEMIMREKDGGFVIPAGGEYLLQPGANHLMLMDVQTPVKAGTQVKFNLVLEDGSNFDFVATAKDYSGANERYVETE